MADPVILDLTHISYSALTEPITAAQVRAFRTQIRAQQRADPLFKSGLATARSILSIVFLIFFVGLFIFLATAVGSEFALNPHGKSSDAIVPLIVLAGFVALIVFSLKQHFGSGGSWAKWMRLAHFADANGLQFRSQSPNPNYTGMIFQLGDARAATNHLNSTRGRFFDLGSFQYSTGSGKSRVTHHWGFLALQLDRKLPNMVLASKKNSTLFGSDLPVTLKRDQILSLEGDFNKHFTLYCPQQYEQDALYVFTPDLMALLIDDAGSFDVEIVDDWMFIYSPHQFPPLSVHDYERLFTIVQTVGSKTVTQTANYHDERVGSASANIVAAQGQRLRHGTSIGSLVTAGAVIAFWLFSTFHGFGSGN